MTNELGYIRRPLAASYIDTQQIQFQPYNPTPTNHTRGRVYYDEYHDALCVECKTSDVTLQVGFESMHRVFNNTANAILNGQVVYVTGAHAGCECATVALALADSPRTCRVLGVATHDIASNTTGNVTYRGIVHGVNTSAFEAGDKLYVHTTIPGYYQTEEPEYPYFPWIVGRCITKHATEGIVCVLQSVEVPFSRFVCLRLSQMTTQTVLTKNTPTKITFDEVLPFPSDTTLIECFPGSGDILFKTRGLYEVVARYQTFRTASAGYATLQFYLRKGTTLPLTRADDLPNTSIQLAIDNNTDRTVQPHTGLLDLQANTYINIMMISDFNGGTVGIESSIGVPEIVGLDTYATPAARAANIVIVKVR